MATKVQILEEAVNISHRANNLSKGIHPTVLPLAMGKPYRAFKLW